MGASDILWRKARTFFMGLVYLTV